MHFISSLLFAFSANIDAFIVGMSCGIKKDHISLLRNVIISLITLSGTVFSITAGLTVLPLLPPKAAQICGSLILILLGMYYIVKSIVLHCKARYAADMVKTAEIAAAEIPEPDKCTINTQKLLTYKDAVLLGLALSINNIGMGIGASITGIALIPTSVLTFLFSILLLALGNHLGEARFFQTVRHFADPLSGFILIGLGIYEFFI